MQSLEAMVDILTRGRERKGEEGKGIPVCQWARRARSSVGTVKIVWFGVALVEMRHHLIGC